MVMRNKEFQLMSFTHIEVLCLDMNEKVGCPVMYTDTVNSVNYAILFIETATIGFFLF